MKETFIINTNSANIVSNIGNIHQDLNRAIELNGPAGRYRMVLEYLKIPYTVYTISAALGNNKMRYHIGTPGTDYDITFPDGTYTVEYLNSYIEATQELNSHFAAYTSGGVTQKRYYFSLGLNNALNRCFFSYLDSSTYPLTITFPASTFYEVIGFAATDTITATTLGSAEPDISQGFEEIYLWSNLVAGNMNGSVGGSGVLYNSIWNGPIGSYCQFPNDCETGQRIDAKLNTNAIRFFEFQIRTAAGAVMSFPTSSVDNITIRFSITDE